MNKLSRLQAIVSQKQDDTDPAHDLLHLNRVVRTCQKLGQELGADLEVLLPAAWLHDIVNLPKNHPDRHKASEQAAVEAEKILQQLEYSAAQIQKILAVITEHSFSAGHSPSSLESQILQDADRLDALGAIGILRLASCGVQFRAKFYHEQDLLAQNRELNDKAYSLDHIFKKLLKLESMMNTAAGKAEAKKRSQFLGVFVEQLKDEIL